MIKGLFSRVSGNPSSVGIELQKNGLAVVVCRCAKNDLSAAGEAGMPSITATQLLLDESADNGQLSMLRDFVEEQGLRQARCNLVLPSSAYQLLLVEAPDVPEQELRDAIRWRVKDLISIPLDQAAFDLFMLPADGSRGGKKMAYVVVVERAKLVSLIELIQHAGLELNAIDIGELALRNIAFLKEVSREEGHGVALVRLVEGGGVVSLYRKGNMYLSRQFLISYNGGLLDDIPIDNFILEVQRSLDYYERQMGQPPPTVLYICGENISEDKVTIDIKRGLSVPVEYLAVEKTFSVAEGIEESLLNSCVVALGGALRDTVAASAARGD